MKARQRRTASSRLGRQLLKPAVPDPQWLLIVQRINHINARRSSARGAGAYARRAPALRRLPLFVLARKGRRDVAHEAVHLFFHLRVRLQADIEIENDLVEAGGLDLFQHLGDAR